MELSHSTASIYKRDSFLPQRKADLAFDHSFGRYYVIMQPMIISWREECSFYKQISLGEVFPFSNEWKLFQIYVRFDGLSEEICLSQYNCCVFTNTLPFRSHMYTFRRHRDYDVRGKIIQTFGIHCFTASTIDKIDKTLESAIRLHFS